jgi:hypothetical protein
MAVIPVVVVMLAVPVGFGRAGGVTGGGEDRPGVGMGVDLSAGAAGLGLGLGVGVGEGGSTTGIASGTYVDRDGAGWLGGGASTAVRAALHPAAASRMAAVAIGLVKGGLVNVGFVNVGFVNGGLLR